MSETPRTDRAIAMDNELDSRAYVRRTCADLERELAVVTADRDHWKRMVMSISLDRTINEMVEESSDE